MPAQESRSTKQLIHPLSVIVLPWVIWLITIILYLYLYFLRLSISGLASELSHCFHIDVLAISNIAASFYYAYLITLIPAGLLLDCFGPRLMLTIAASVH